MSLLKNGYSTLSLGYVGIGEMTQAMLGVSHTTKEGEKFALEVMQSYEEINVMNGKRKQDLDLVYMELQQKV